MEVDETIKTYNDGKNLCLCCFVANVIFDGTVIIDNMIIHKEIELFLNSYDVCAMLFGWMLFMLILICCLVLRLILKFEHEQQNR